MKKPTMFIFMGGQGSGKGTFAKLLLKQNNYDYIETGAILRNMPADSEIAKKMSRGELVSDADLFPIISQRLSANTNVIMDGFPRTLPQAQWLIENYSDKFDIKIIFLNISAQHMMARIQKRINQGENRQDDADMAAIQKRIAEFENKTMPAIQWLQTIKNITFYDIELPGDDIDDNFAIIMKTIGK